MKNAIWSKIVIVLILAVCTWYGKNLDNWGHNRIIQNDVISYYAYLPATFIFHDLNFEFTKDLPEDFEGKIWLQYAPNGKPILRMTMGLALLWTPFFLMGHVLAHLTDVSTLGYSWPYSFSIFAAAVFYLFAGLLFLRKILLRYFSDITTALVLFVSVVATNLMYYVISEPGMSHVFNFCLITAFLYFSLKWIDKPSYKFSIALGGLFGIIILIRPINILVILFPLLIGIKSFKDLTARVTIHWELVLLTTVCAFVVVIPQLLYWKAQTGHFLFNSYMDQGKFFFSKPQIINGLFSYRKGWLLYTPLMVFALLGLWNLKKMSSGLFYPMLIFLLINIYVIYSWWCWWYGGCFGSRPMIDAYGLLAIPLAAFVERLFKGKLWLRVTILVLFLGFTALNQFQMNQYRTSLLHWDSMTKKAYWGIMFKKKWPENYGELIKTPDYDKALRGENEYP